MNKRIASSLFGLVFLLAACGTTYSHEKSVDNLVNDAGIDRETAECIVDGMEANFSEEKLLSEDDPTPEDEEIIGQISTDCVLGG